MLVCVARHLGLAISQDLLRNGPIGLDIKLDFTMGYEDSQREKLC